MEEKNLSCADCGIFACSGNGKDFPEFCTSAKADEALREETRQHYTADPEDSRIMAAASKIEYEYYGKHTRVEELADYCEIMGIKKAGIASCLGLIKESQTLAKFLRKRGLEPIVVACKCGSIKKVDVGLPEEHEATGVNICNPVLQARLLEREGAELNVVMGLCLGHDILFNKYSKAPTTTLVVKDRVTVHNTVAPLYAANTFYAKKLR